MRKMITIALLLATTSFLPAAVAVQADSFQVAIELV